MNRIWNRERTLGSGDSSRANPCAPTAITVTDKELETDL